MIVGMNATEIAEYFAVVNELEPDVALDGMDHNGQWTVAGGVTVHELNISEVPGLAQLCDQLPKVPTLDEQCARHRLEFQDEIRGLRSAGIATILCGLVLFALVIYWRSR